MGFYRHRLENGQWKNSKKTLHVVVGVACIRKLTRLFRTLACLWRNPQVPILATAKNTRALRTAVIVEVTSGEDFFPSLFPVSGLVELAEGDLGVRIVSATVTAPI